ncbi:MAG: XdhC family protein [Spirochaetes bacterium]|nr:XdhC family protein [Spirochaetota bacterium]
MNNIFMACAALLEAGEDVAMVTIINREGSAPRTAGSKMLVRRDGSIVGTIGGGLFEAQAISLAQEIHRGRQAVTRTFNFTGNEVTEMDMVCGGRAEIFVDLLQCRFPENAAVCRAIGDVKKGDRGAILVTEIATGPGSEERTKLALITGSKESVGMPLSEDSMEALGRLQGGRSPQLVSLGEKTYQIEPVHLPGTVYIFGAGHVSQRLAHLTAYVGFQTVVLDDREEYANEKRFPQADRIVVPESMEGCMENLQISRNGYIVIVTRGHAYDMNVLAQALRTDAGYIGMIGSIKKRETIYQHLRRSGVGDAALARVHCPIGIDIDAETPEEIAVSIAGELIQARAGLIDG